VFGMHVCSIIKSFYGKPIIGGNYTPPIIAWALSCLRPEPDCTRVWGAHLERPLEREEQVLGEKFLASMMRLLFTD